VLRYAIAFALRRARKIVRGLKEGVTEDERLAVPDHNSSVRTGARRLFVLELNAGRIHTMNTDGSDKEARL
jgi:hypothetical protein